LKTQFLVRCDTNPPFCLRQFTVRVDSQHEGKKIRVECPGCCNKLKVTVPTSDVLSEGVTRIEEAVSTVAEKVEEVFTTLSEIKVSDVVEHLTGRGSK
jgi:hypothetical protein